MKLTFLTVLGLITIAMWAQPDSSFFAQEYRSVKLLRAYQDHLTEIGKCFRVNSFILIIQFDQASRIKSIETDPPSNCSQLDSIVRSTIDITDFWNAGIAFTTGMEYDMPLNPDSLKAAIDYYVENLEGNKFVPDTVGEERYDPLHIEIEIDSVKVDGRLTVVDKRFETVLTSEIEILKLTPKVHFMLVRKKNKFKKLVFLMNEDEIELVQSYDPQEIPEEILFGDFGKTMKALKYLFMEKGESINKLNPIYAQKK